MLIMTSLSDSQKWASFVLNDARIVSLRKWASFVSKWRRDSLGKAYYVPHGETEDTVSQSEVIRQSSAVFDKQITMIMNICFHDK